MYLCPVSMSSCTASSSCIACAATRALLTPPTSSAPNPWHSILRRYDSVISSLIAPWVWAGPSLPSLGNSNRSCERAWLTCVSHMTVTWSSHDSLFNNPTSSLRSWHCRKVAAQWARSDNWPPNPPTHNKSDMQVPSTARLCETEEEGVSVACARQSTCCMKLWATVWSEERDRAVMTELASLCQVHRLLYMYIVLGTQDHEIHQKNFELSKYDKLCELKLCQSLDVSTQVSIL